MKEKVVRLAPVPTSAEEQARRVLAECGLRPGDPPFEAYMATARSVDAAVRLGDRIEALAARLEKAGTPFDPRAYEIMRATLRRAVGALGWRRVAVAFAVGLVAGGIGAGMAVYWWRDAQLWRHCQSVYALSACAQIAGRL
jgi:hypothetical protein